MGAIGVFNFGDERHEVQLTLVGAFAKIRVRNRNRTWSNQFQAGYIEQLTQRTGSFKSFAAFCQCLSSAIQSTSTEATLELLTPTDLDALRVNKGQAGRTQNPDRRYLLLVITDSTFNTRVHYPLSLNEEVQEPLPLQPVHQNAPTVQQSQEIEIHTIVRQLQDEIRRLQHPEGPSFREKFEEMVLLNKKLKDELEEAKKTISNAKSVKMNKQMKKMVDNMEKALSDEKTRSKRTISDQKAKIRTLEKELTEVRTEAKHLEIRNRALSNELATYKRSKVRGRVSRDSSRESRVSRVSQPRISALRGRDSRDSSRERTKRPPTYARPTSSSRTRQMRSRDPSPSGSVRSVASSVGSYRSCSSRGSTASRASRGRFDPTAYVRAKKLKEEEAKRRHSGGRHRSAPNLTQSSKHSRISTKSSNRALGGKNRSSTPDPLIVTTDDESDFDLHNKYGLKPSGDQLPEDSLIKEGSFNINEIDARLSALQQYMDDLVAH